MRVVPFEETFVDAAAELLAAAHTGAPVVNLADVDVARAGLAWWATVGPAVAAVADDGTLAGFMIATVDGSPGDPTACIRMLHHAAPGGARMTYRRLYQEISRRLAGLGCFEHMIVIAGQRAVVDCFVELGFGFDQIKGMRSLAPPDRAGRDVPMRPAQPDDLADLLRLTVELQYFHAEAPMLRPALIDLPAMRADLRAAITDERRLVLVAEEAGRPVGLMVVDPDNRFTGAAAIGIAVVAAAVRAKGVGTALLSGAVDWAARRGFRVCVTEWSSANLVSDAFWRGHGFAPVRHALTRRIDPRVAWADARLPYPDPPVVPA